MAPEGGRVVEGEGVGWDARGLSLARFKMADDSLGSIRGTFRPTRASLLGGLIVGLGFALGPPAAAAAVRFSTLRQTLKLEERTAAVVLAILFGLALTGFGVWMLVRMARLCFHRVIVCDRGFRYGPSWNERTCHWMEIGWVEESTMAFEPPKTARVFVVEHHKKGRFTFDVNSTGDIVAFAKLLTAARKKHGFRWQVAGQSVA